MCSRSAHGTNGKGKGVHATNGNRVPGAFCIKFLFFAKIKMPHKRSIYVAFSIVRNKLWTCAGILSCVCVKMI